MINQFVMLNDNDCLAIFYLLVAAGCALYLTALYEKFAKQTLAKQAAGSKGAGTSETIAPKGDQITQPVKSIEVEVDAGFDSSTLAASWQQVQEVSPPVEHFSDPVCQFIFNIVGYHPQMITLLNESITTIVAGAIGHIVMSKFLPEYLQFFKLGDMPGLKMIRAISSIKLPGIANFVSPGVSIANSVFRMQYCFACYMLLVGYFILSSMMLYAISESKYRMSVIDFLGHEFTKRFLGDPRDHTVRVLVVPTLIFYMLLVMHHTTQGLFC